tara:strand:+ start:59 stop:1378 length:1320 start_codon:yes stop_codon:yes gene_type:complete
MNLIKRFFQPSLFISSLFLFIFTFYKSEILHEGTIREYYQNFYILSIILFFFSILWIFINENLKKYFLIIFSSIIISVYIFEVYLTFHNNNVRDLKTKFKLYKEETGKEYDKSTSIEALLKERKKDKNATMVVPFTYFLNNDDNKIFALSGISNSKTIFCNQNGYFSTYKSDRFGFNNPDNEWDKKEIEYLLIGDSFVQGACVNNPDDIGSVLRSLSKKSVLNLGYAAKGPLSEYATLREYIRPNIKKIIWFYFEGNDLDNLKAEMKSDILIRYLKDINFSQNLVKKQSDIDLLGKELVRQEEESLTKLKDDNKIRKIINFIKIYRTRLLFSEETKVPSQLKEILALTKQLSQENNSEFYLVYLPNYYRYRFNLKKESSLKDLKKIAQDLEIPFIDIDKQVFKKERDPLELFPFKMHGHYNVLGYKKVMKAVYELTSND